MPYYTRRPRYRWRRRRWFRPGRPRKTFFKRRWRRHRRVRFRKKAKSIRIRQYQPASIRKLKVVGSYPLFLTTHDRLSNIMNMWLDSIAPRYIPSAGGFSISAFSLETLYKEHLRLNNWWTHSNDNYPLIKYQGCTIKLWKSINVDYLFSYQNNYPMRASELMYHSTHPQVMLLNNRKKTILCKQHNKSGKLYKKIFIPPPSQMMNKWYFQKDIATIPLVLTIASACSLDRMFLHANSPSTTIGFTSLNTDSFRDHHFTNYGNIGYKPQDNQQLFILQNGAYDIKDIKFGDLTYLGNTDAKQKGILIRQTQGESTNSEADKITKYFQNKENWGNPFIPPYIQGDKRMIITNLTIDQIKEQYKSFDTKLDNTKWTFKSTPNTLECRYNPIPDTGIGNKIYLLKINRVENQYSWQPPQEENILSQNLPLWLLTWGYIDWQKKLAQYQQIDTTTVLVIQSKFIEPKDLTFYVPLDYKFLEGTSPFRPQYEVTPADTQNWHPKVLFQLVSVNNIAASGPTTAKLPKDISAEAHMFYKFHFKLGGNPPPMSGLTDPDDQPKFPTPDNMLRTTSLQSPTLPFEHLLYHFDERRGQITENAAKRIKKDSQTEKLIIPFTERSTTDLPAPYKTPQTTDSSDTEEEKTPEELLKQQLQQQRLLRKRIEQLIMKM
nr:MAG: ORF1 [TTV-like mini virus]